MSSALYWEHVDGSEDSHEKLVTERAAVHGGWLVRIYDVDHTGRPYHPSITFVPDPDYSWALSNEG